MSIIDAHIHLNPKAKAPISDLLFQMDSREIGKAMLILNVKEEYDDKGSHCKLNKIVFIKFFIYTATLIVNLTSAQLIFLYLISKLSFHSLCT